MELGAGNPGESMILPNPTEMMAQYEEMVANGGAESDRANPTVLAQIIYQAALGIEPDSILEEEAFSEHPELTASRIALRVCKAACAHLEENLVELRKDQRDEALIQRLPDKIVLPLVSFLATKDQMNVCKASKHLHSIMGSVSS
mmetsp:Transcript_46662/g.63544  ORF Transcript_46662/g.63544 Transcript_46662/m.63544 type:complete len:145 (-) Transcript_46662:270-704(-)